MSRPSAAMAAGTIVQLHRRFSSAHDQSSASSNVTSSVASSVTGQDPFELSNLHRPAKPRSSIPINVSQIVQYIKVVRSIETYTTNERLAIICDVASCLPTLQKYVTASGSPKALTTKASTLITLLKNAIREEKTNLESTLDKFSRTNLPNRLSREEFEDYVNEVESFLDMIRPFAKETGLRDEWVKFAVSILQQYFQLLPKTEEEESNARTSLRSWPTLPDHEGPQPRTPPNSASPAFDRARINFTLPILVAIPPLDDNVNQDVALQILREIHTYLTTWNQMNPGLYGEDALAFSPYVAVIIDTIEAIDSVNNRILLSDLVREGLFTFFETWTNFVEFWGTATENALAERLLLLQQQTRASPIQVPEAVFTTIMDDIQTLLRHPLLQASGNVHYSNPRTLISDKFASRARKFCDLQHHTWQSAAYQSELHQLWLLIWRTLKTIFKVQETSNDLKRAEKSFLDVAFFEKSSIKSTFAQVLKTSDSANPRSVENIVAQYCRMIAKCRNDLDPKYDYLRNYNETELRAHVMKYLERFIEAGYLKDNLLQKLHRAVIRLNFLNNGPATIRRWDENNDGGDWAVERLDMMVPIKTFVPGPNSPTGLDNQELIVEGEDVIEPSLSSLPHPIGINVKSAFRYVYHPFPETRAHEVAQSTQISRDLQDPGTMSRGLRVEDLINLPPRHVRGLLSASRVLWPSFITPSEYVKSTAEFLLTVYIGWRRKSGLGSSSRRRAKNASVAGSQHILGQNHRVKKHLHKGLGVSIRGGASGPTKLSHRAISSQRGLSDNFRVEHFRMFRDRLPGYPIDDSEALYFLTGANWDLDIAQRTFETIYEFRTYLRPSDRLHRDEIIEYLDETGWDVNRAFESYQDQKPHIDAFRGAIASGFDLSHKYVIKYLAAAKWDADVALRQHNIDLNYILVFRGGLHDHDLITNEEILDRVEAARSDVKAALTLYQREKQALPSPWEGSPSGDSQRTNDSDQENQDPNRENQDPDQENQDPQNRHYRNNGSDNLDEDRGAGRSGRRGSDIQPRSPRDSDNGRCYPCVDCPDGIYHICRCVTRPVGNVRTGSQGELVVGWLDDSNNQNQQPQGTPRLRHECPKYPGTYHRPGGNDPYNDHTSHNAKIFRRKLPAYLRRPERYRHWTDDRIANQFFMNVPDNSRGERGEIEHKFKQYLRHMKDTPPTGSGAIAFLVGPDGFGVPKLTDRLWRYNVATMIGVITQSTRNLREAFVRAFNEYMPMDGVCERLKVRGQWGIYDYPYDIYDYGRVCRRIHTDQAATIKLCQRSAFDVKAYCDRIHKIVFGSVTSSGSGIVHDNTILGLRHELGRFIRTVKDLRSLYAELVLNNDFDPQDLPGLILIDEAAGNHHEEDDGDTSQRPDPNDPTGRHDRGLDNDGRQDVDSTDSEADDSNSGDEDEYQVVDENPKVYTAPGLLNRKPGKLPSTNDYRKMFMDEIERELLRERKVPEAVLKQYKTKEDRIQLLMELDSRGIYGEGARNGYFALEGKAGRRPADWHKQFEKRLAVAKRDRIARWKSGQVLRRRKRQERNDKKIKRNEDRNRRRLEQDQEDGENSEMASMQEVSDPELLSKDTSNGHLISEEGEFVGPPAMLAGSPNADNVAREAVQQPRKSPAPEKVYKRNSRGRLAKVDKENNTEPRNPEKKLRKLPKKVVRSSSVTPSWET